MKSAFEYRAYEVSNDGGFYIAKSFDGDPGQFRSKRLIRVIRSIDALWDAVQTGHMPEWISTYLQGNSLHCDLDALADSLAPSLPALCPSSDNVRFFPSSAKPVLAVSAAA